tara:strand:- start:1516 stop:2214 length:699 start_codon:yes stop_codon:yes gene_type:complete
MSTSVIKRIVSKDLKGIKTNDLNSMGIFVEFNEENLLEAKAMIIGPKDSVYEGGILFFKLFYPKNYPFSPPDVCYVSRNRVRIHPNYYTRHHHTGHGKVCLSILGTWDGPKWTSIMDTSTVLITMQSLLDKNPLYHEPKIEDPILINNYNKIINHESIQTLFLRNTFDIPTEFEIFTEQIKENYEKNKDYLFDKIQKNINIKEKVFSNIYRFDYPVDYKRLSEVFKEYSQKL